MNAKWAQREQSAPDKAPPLAHQRIEREKEGDDDHASEYNEYDPIRGISLRIEGLPGTKIDIVGRQSAASEGDGQCSEACQGAATEEGPWST